MQHSSSLAINNNMISFSLPFNHHRYLVCLMFICYRPCEPWKLSDLHFLLKFNQLVVISHHCCLEFCFMFFFTIYKPINFPMRKVQQYLFRIRNRCRMIKCLNQRVFEAPIIIINSLCLLKRNNLITPTAYTYKISAVWGFMRWIRTLWMEATMYTNHRLSTMLNNVPVSSIHLSWKASITVHVYVGFMMKHYSRNYELN